jgi:hypothetical protein
MDSSSMGQGRPPLPKSGGLVPNVAYPVGIQSNRHTTDSGAYPAGSADTTMHLHSILLPSSQSASGTSIVATVDNDEDR